VVGQAKLLTRWYHTYGMRKTTVYLNEDEAEALRQLAAATGMSQSELIRSAIRQAVAQLPPRRFHSLGRGRGTGASGTRWTPAEVYDKAFGRH
jgi:predicted transcriptional regulator